MNNLSKLKYYIFNIAFSIVFLIILVFSSSKIGHELFIILVGLMIVECCYELVGLVGLKRKFAILLTSIIYPAIVIVLVRVFDEEIKWVKYILLLTIIYLIFMFTISMISNGIVRIGQVTQIISFSLYFVLSLISLILIRYSYTNSGNLYYVSLFVISIGTSLAFKLINMFFGKHKIFPRLKIDFSFEGLLGSLLFSLFIEIVHGFILTRYFNVKIHWLYFILMTLMCSSLTIITKLIFMYLKKENDISHFSSFIPKQHGILEIYDSTLFICPVMYLIYTAFNPLLFTI